jgi:ABC-type uncharacterized transport system substrate-binding protein
MKRRDFIGIIAAGAAAWPISTLAEQPERIRRIGALFPLPQGDPEWQKRLEEFTKSLRQLGWTDGRNMQLETRWSAGDPADTRKAAAELVAHGPDVVLATGGVGIGAMLQTSHTVPTVFVIVPDPVGSGFVASLRRPGGNATGFMMFEYNLVGKWVQLLKQIAPLVTRAAILWDPTTAVGVGQFAVIQSVAPSLGVDVSPLALTNEPEIMRAISAFADEPNGGLILTGSAKSAVYHKLIIDLARRHKLPAVYHERFYVADGGLISYGPNFLDQYRKAAVYVDRILHGEKPGEMPVQVPTNYELIINLHAAKDIGLAVPSTLLAQANEVIE